MGVMMELRDLIYSKENIINWKWVSLEKDQVRIYYKWLLPHYMSFYIVEWISGGVGNLSTDDVEMWCVFHGSATSFDGVRHMYAGDIQTDNENYLCYPNLKQLSRILLALDKLIKKHKDV